MVVLLNLAVFGVPAVVPVVVVVEDRVGVCRKGLELDGVCTSKLGAIGCVGHWHFLGFLHSI